MYLAKKRGGNQLSFFSPDLEQSVGVQRRLIADLRQALAKHQLAVYLPADHGDGRDAFTRQRHYCDGVILKEA